MSGGCARSRGQVVRSTLPKAGGGVRSHADTSARRGAERSAGALRRSARTSAASTAPGGARAGARRIRRHPAAHGCTGSSRRRCPQPAQPARASEARSATSAARSAVARRAKRASGIVSGTSARRGVLFGKRSAQRAPASGGDRDCSGNRSEAEIAAESPAAKRVAQIVRMDTRTRIHHRQHRHHHRLHLGRQYPMTWSPAAPGILGISIDEIATIVGPNTGNVIGAHRTLSSSVARR